MNKDDSRRCTEFECTAPPT